MQVDRLALGLATLTAFAYLYIAHHEMEPLQLAFTVIFLYAIAAELGFSFAEPATYFRHRTKAVVVLRLASALMSLCVPRLVLSGGLLDAVKLLGFKSKMALRTQFLLLILTDATWVLSLLVGAVGWQLPFALSAAVQTISLAVVMSQASGGPLKAAPCMGDRSRDRSTLRHTCHVLCNLVSHYLPRDSPMATSRLAWEVKQSYNSIAPRKLKLLVWLQNGKICAAAFMHRPDTLDLLQKVMWPLRAALKFWAPSRVSEGAWLDTVGCEVGLTLLQLVWGGIVPLLVMWIVPWGARLLG
jgi:hypothetical protein